MTNDLLLRVVEIKSKYRLLATLRLKKYSMPFQKVEMILKFPKCLHLEKLLLAYVIILLMPYNFCNYNIFISLKIAVIFKVDEVIAPPCIYPESKACGDRF